MLALIPCINTVGGGHLAEESVDAFFISPSSAHVLNQLSGLQRFLSSSNFCFCCINKPRIMRFLAPFAPGIKMWLSFQSEKMDDAKNIGHFWPISVVGNHSVKTFSSVR